MAGWGSCRAKLLTSLKRDKYRLYTFVLFSSIDSSHAQFGVVQEFVCFFEYFYCPPEGAETYVL